MAYLRFRFRELWPAIVVGGGHLTFYLFSNHLRGAMRLPGVDRFSRQWLALCGLAGFFVGTVHGMARLKQGTGDYHRHRAQPAGQAARAEWLVGLSIVAVIILLPVMIRSATLGQYVQPSWGWVPAALTVGTVAAATYSIGWWAAAHVWQVHCLGLLTALSWGYLSIGLTLAGGDAYRASHTLFLVAQGVVALAFGWWGNRSRHTDLSDSDVPIPQRRFVGQVIAVSLAAAMLGTAAGRYLQPAVPLISFPRVYGHQLDSADSSEDGGERAASFVPYRDTGLVEARSARRRDEGEHHGPYSSMMAPRGSSSGRWDGYWDASSRSLWTNVLGQWTETALRLPAAADPILVPVFGKHLSALVAARGHSTLWAASSDGAVHALDLGSAYVDSFDIEGDGLYVVCEQAVLRGITGPSMSLQPVPETVAETWRARASAERLSKGRREDAVARFVDPCHIDVTFPGEQGEQTVSLVSNGYRWRGVLGAALKPPALLGWTAVFPPGHAGRASVANTVFRDGFVAGAMTHWVWSLSVMLCVLVGWLTHRRLKGIGVPRARRAVWLLAIACVGPAGGLAAWLMETKRAWAPWPEAGPTEPSL